MHPRTRQPGFMLLEVLVAIGLLVLGMAVIGGQVQTAADLTRETDHLARLVFLAESRLAEIDSGLVVPNEEIGDETGVEVEEDFGRLFPQYASRVTIRPTATPELVAVRLDIMFDPARMILEEGADLDEFDYDDELIVQTFHTLRAVPRPLNLKTDFGLDDEIADTINEELQNSGVGGGLDVENFNPAVFKDLDLEQLVELIGILQNAFGADQSALLALVPADVRPQLAALLAGLDATGGDDGSGDGTGTSGGSDTGGGSSDDGRGGSDAGGNDRGSDDRGSDDRGGDGGDASGMDSGGRDDADAGTGANGRGGRGSRGRGGRGRR
jgi:hypothetical protein